MCKSCMVVETLEVLFTLPNHKEIMFSVDLILSVSHNTGTKFPWQLMSCRTSTTVPPRLTLSHNNGSFML